MSYQDVAIGLAGVIGLVTAIIHGYLTERFLSRPIGQILAAEGSTAAPIRKLVPVLFHYSTTTWFVGGVALVVASIWSEPQTQLTLAAAVGATYLYGAIGNMWATGGRHPGWMLLAASVILILFGIST
jgi:hypothetical protein